MVERLLDSLRGTAPFPFRRPEMKSTRKPHHGDMPYPQPLAEPGEQRPQHFQDEDEADAFSRWLAHVEAGRIGSRD